MEKLGLSDSAAYRRIHAARTARRLPDIFPAVADGRLSLSVVVMLAPHLTDGNASELLKAAARRSRVQVEALLAERFPRTELLPMVHALPEGRQDVPSAVRGAGSDAAISVAVTGNQHFPGRVGASAPRSRLSPLVPGRFALQVTLRQETHELIRHAQELAGPQASSGDLDELINQAFRAYVERLEKRKFAATARPRTRRRRGEASPRHIPAHVKRAVWQCDGGRCTFVGDNGHRCTAPKFLEFDHVTPVARGGRASGDGIRLRCRAHNQFEAERAFGADFMAGKREAARTREDGRRCAMPARAGAAAAEAAQRAVPRPGAQSGDLATALRTLGFRAGQVHQAVAFCAQRSEETLEGQMRAALAWLCPKRGMRASTLLESGGRDVGGSVRVAVPA